MAKRDAETALEEMDRFFFLESGREVKLSGEGEHGAHYSTFRGMENACIDSVVLRKKHVHHRNMRRNMKDD